MSHTAERPRCQCLPSFTCACFRCAECFRILTPLEEQYPGGFLCNPCRLEAHDKTMICQHCEVNLATFHSVTIENGQKTEQHSCEDCAPSHLKASAKVQEIVRDMPCTGERWFTEKVGNTSPTFEAWWLGFYGKPEDYDNRTDEQDEYWTRKAFAWHGWCGHALKAPPGRYKADH